MTDKQIKLDGSFIPIEEAIKAGLISEEDINAPHNRPDWRITLQADHIKRLEEELQAKEQECERLEYEVGSLENDRDILQDKLDQLKAENERLQEEREKAKNYNLEYGQLLIKATNENLELKSENKHLNDLLNQALKELEKTRETLTEIKEIAENCCINQATLDCENYDDCTQCGRISDGEGIQQILQKISECEGNDE